MLGSNWALSSLSEFRAIVAGCLLTRLDFRKCKTSMRYAASEEICDVALRFIAQSYFIFLFTTSLFPRRCPGTYLSQSYSHMFTNVFNTLLVFLTLCHFLTLKL
jgi:hypothetical protein